MAIHLEIPNVPPGPNGPRGLLRMSGWRRQQLRRTWLYEIEAAKRSLGQHIPVAPRGSLVRIVQYRSKLMDQDNLVASCKVILDALVRCGLIVDDDPQSVILEVSQGWPCHGLPRTEIDVGSGL